MLPLNLFLLSNILYWTYGQICPEFHYFNTFNSRCLSCQANIFPRNCKTCEYGFSGFKCKSCAAPYYLSSEQNCEQNCKQLVSDLNCKECDHLANNYACRKCEEGFGLDEGGICKKCTKECDPCCTECPEGWVPQGGVCLMCRMAIPFCNKCIPKLRATDSNKCVECEPRYSPNHSGDKCESCLEKTGLENCSQCKQANYQEWVCIKCTPGYLMVNGKCELCPAINNCWECKSSELCSSCSPGYFLVVTNELSCSKCENPLYTNLTESGRKICAPFPVPNPNVAFQFNYSMTGNLFFARVKELCLRERDWDNRLTAFFYISSENDVFAFETPDMNRIVAEYMRRGEYFFEEDEEKFRAFGSVEDADGEVEIIIPRKNFNFGWTCRNQLNMFSKKHKAIRVDVESSFSVLTNLPSEIIILTTFANLTEQTQLTCNLAEVLQISSKRIIANNKIICPQEERHTVFPNLSFIKGRRFLEPTTNTSSDVIRAKVDIIKNPPEFHLYNMDSFNSTLTFKIRESVFEPFIFNFQGDSLPRWNKLLDVRWWIINRNTGVDPLAQSSFFINKSKISTRPPNIKLDLRIPLHLKSRSAVNITLEAQGLVYLVVTEINIETIAPQSVVSNQTEVLIFEVAAVAGPGSILVGFDFPKKGEYNLFYFSKSFDLDIFSAVQRVRLEVYLFSWNLLGSLVNLIPIILVYMYW